MKKLGISLISVAIILAVAAIGFQSSSVTGYFRDESKPAVSSSATPTIPDSTRNSPSSTEERVYSFERKLEARIQGESLLDLTYSGQLKITSSKLRDGAISSVARIEFDEPTLEKFSPDLREFARRESPALAFVIDPNGELTQIKTLIAPPAASRLFDEKKKILIDLVAQYAFFSRTDSIGEYDAQFSQMSAHQVRKEKTAYRALRSEIAHRIVSSIHDLTWSESGVESVVGREVIESGNESMQMVQSSSYFIQKKERRTASVTSADRIEENFESTTIAREIRDRKPAGQNVTRKTWSWAELLPRLRKISRVSPSEKMKTFHELIRSLSKSPALIGQLEALIRENPKDDALFKLGIGALASAGGAAAEQSLKRIYASSTEEPEKQRMILTAFTATDAPITGETQEFLKSIAIEPAPAPGFNESAAYALGASLKKEQDVALVNELRKTLIDLLAQSKTNYEKATYLDAIGNSGDASLLPQIRDYLNSENAVLREKAVFSLRWMAPANVGSHINQALEDPQASVRRSAVQAIRYQKDAGQSIDTYQDKINLCARQDASYDLRRQCARMQTGAET